MKQQTYTTTILTADDGHMLTETADVDIAVRTIASEVALGRGDIPGNYREITTDEATALLAEQAAAIARIDAQRMASMAEAVREIP